MKNKKIAILFSPTSTNVIVDCFSYLYYYQLRLGIIVGPGSSQTTLNIANLLFIYLLFFLSFCVPGHDRYYNKYINVKKGGIGGIAMLLVGYVAMSYMWEYDHISKTFPHSLPRYL